MQKQQYARDEEPPKPHLLERLRCIEFGVSCYTRAVRRFFHEPSLPSHKSASCLIGSKGRPTYCILRPGLLWGYLRPSRGAVPSSQHQADCCRGRIRHWSGVSKMNHVLVHSTHADHGQRRTQTSAPAAERQFCSRRFLESGEECHSPQARLLT